MQTCTAQNLKYTENRGCLTEASFLKVVDYFHFRFTFLAVFSYLSSQCEKLKSTLSR